MILSNLELKDVNLTSIESALCCNVLQLQHSSRINSTNMNATATVTLWPSLELLKSIAHIKVLLFLPLAPADIPNGLPDTTAADSEPDLQEYM